MAFDINTAQPEQQIQPQQTGQPTGGFDLSTAQPEQQQVGGFTRATFEPIQTGRPKSPLNLLQELTFSGAGNDRDLQMDYVKKVLPESAITMSDDNRILVDGTPLNPEGFDLGDISRNALDVLPLGGQVLGSLGGLSAGSAAGPVGIVVGGIVGGVAGANVGRQAQLAIGDFFGLDVNGRDYLEALGDESKIALTGEILGAGIVGAGSLAGKGARAIAKPLSRTKVAKGMSNLWKGAIGKLKGATPDVFQFVFSTDPSVTNYMMNKNLNFNQSMDDILNFKFFEDGFSLERSVGMLFNKKMKQEQYANFINTIGKQKSNALVDLADNIAKNSKDMGYRQLLKLMGADLSDETVDQLARKGSGSILSGVNLKEDRSITVANRIIDFLTDNEKRIGKQLGKMRSDAIKANPTKEVNVEDTISGLSGIVQRFNRAVTKTGKPPKVKGLNKVVEILESMVDDTGVVSTKTLTLRQLDHLDRNILDPVADEIFKNKNISGAFKTQFREVLEGFRAKVDDTLGIGRLNQDYSFLKGIMADTKINRSTAVQSMENVVRNFGKQNQLTKDTLIDALRSVGDKGLKLEDDILSLSAGRELLDLDTKLPKMVSKLQNQFEASNFLKGGDREMEVLLRNISGTSNAPQVGGFFKDVMNRQVAKEFSNQGANVLRLQTILGILGFGSLGPLGGVGGFAAASQLNPKSLAKILRSASRRKAAAKGIPEFVSRKAKQVASERNKATARALLGRLVNQGNTNQQ